jgi:hypothetical protein
MIFIFGIAYKSKRERPLLDTHCYTCSRVTTWDWYRVGEWFSLFFVALLPVKDEHFLLCSSCGDRLQLTANEARGVKNLKQLAPAESQSLHDHLVQRLEDLQLADKTQTQREYLKSKRS